MTSIGKQITWTGLAAAAALSLVVLAHPTSISMAPEHIHGAEMNAQAAGSESGSAARPVPSVRVVSCEKLPDIPGKSITTTVVDFPPGAYSSKHRHPGTVTAYVLKGTVRSQLAGGPAEVFTVGQTWFEPPKTIHLFAENASATEPAELLAIFVADDDCGPLTIRD